MDTEALHEIAKLRERCVLDVLNERRRDENISFRALGTLSGIAHSTIYGIFNETTIKVWQVFVLAEALGMSLRELVYLTDERFREEYVELYAATPETVSI